jgi:polyhydroxybutyrate depolymerase
VEPAPVKRHTVLASVLALILLPAALAVVEASRYIAHHRNSGTIMSSGLAREYLLHVPASYDPSKATPLVISLHGAALWPAGQMEVSQWNRIADRQGFIVVYPSGVSGHGPRAWNVNRGAGLQLDVKFIADLIDTLKATHNIDPSRIYADGLSNGGGMAWVLSCTLSDRIAAVGQVASANLLPWSWCTDTRPVPMIAFHGTADTVTPYHGGATWVAPNPFPDIPAWTAAWARRNRCAPTPIDGQVAADVTRRTYASCDAPVELYTILGGGHNWPGGGPLPEWFAGTTSRSIDASAVMWDFFQKVKSQK